MKEWNELCETSLKEITQHNDTKNRYNREVGQHQNNRVTISMVYFEGLVHNVHCHKTLTALLQKHTSYSL